MIQVDLHPEQLFDALRAGRLSARERARLEAHCAQCPVCLFELRWLDTQRVAQAPSAEDHAYGEAAFDRVLRAARPQRPAQTRGARGATSGQLRWGLGGLLLGAGIGAALLAGRALWPAPDPRLGTLPQFASRSVETLPPVAWRRAIPPATPAPPRARPTGAKSSASDKPSADSLLAAARQASTSGELQRAVRLYRQVIRRFPASPAAGAAQLALGHLLQSELGQPKAALALFDVYLRQHPEGALAEEALYYRALSLDSLGRTREGSAELRRLLRAFPHSMYAESARARLAREPAE